MEISKMINNLAEKYNIDVFNIDKDKNIYILICQIIEDISFLNELVKRNKKADVVFNVLPVDIY
jgi:hypothetical protein